MFDQFSAAVHQATTEACDTANGWGLPVNRDDRASGGLYWATYKALCRRDGLFSNKQGLHDWNAELTAPIIKNITNGWERTFSRRMPSVLNGLANKSGTLLTTFHKTVEARAMRNGTSLASLEVLKQQLPTYKDTMKDLSTAAQTQIAARQKDINREFVPVVAEAMKQVYNDCENESGPVGFPSPHCHSSFAHRSMISRDLALACLMLTIPKGQYARMKAMMSRHVDGVRRQMFNDSTNAVKNSLKKLVNDIQDFMLEKADEVFMSVKRDYEAVVLGIHAATQQLPREQRQLRFEVNGLIEGTESIFKKVVGLEPETREASIEDPEEKGASPTAEAVGPDETAEDTNDDAVTGAARTDEDDNEAVERTVNATAQQSNKDSRSTFEESGTPVMSSHYEHSEVARNNPLADPLLGDEQVSPKAERARPLAEASNGLNIPAAATRKMPPHDESQKENELLKARSMATRDVEQELDRKSAESSPQPERSSSAASWVQSWWSPRA